MDESTRRQIDRIARENRASATAVVPLAVAVLQEALDRGPDALETVARAVCAAQPSMGSV